MEENKFYNIKEFKYIIDVSNINRSAYDREIKNAIAEYKMVETQTTSLENLIEKLEEEIAKTSIKDEYEQMVSNKTNLIDKLIKAKMLSSVKATVLKNLYFKDYKLKELVKNIQLYNDNLTEINKIIKQYNYDIIYDEKNTESIVSIKNFKDYISKIINFDDESITVGIDLNTLKKYYNKLSDIENYYTCCVVKKKLKTDDDYKATDINDFIFIDVDSNLNSVKAYNTNKHINEYNYKETNATKPKHCFESGNIDYIVYCEQVSGNIVRRHKPKHTHKIKRVRKAARFDKIKKSIRKNFRKVVAGLLVGVTMIGMSTFGVGLSSNNKATDTNSAVVSTNIEYSKEETKCDESYNNIINVDNIRDVSTNKSMEASEIDITIGTKVEVNGNIYINSNDAYNEENGLDATYSKNDEREVSLIAYRNSDGNTCIVNKDNKEKINELKKLKYEVISYCLDNNTHNVDNEGWYNVDNVKMLSR